MKKKASTNTHHTSIAYLWLGGILLILTAFILCANYLFYIDGYFNIPQFGHFENFQNDISEIKQSYPYNYKIFEWFFYLDFFWAASLLTFLHGALGKIRERSNENPETTALNIKKFATLGTKEKVHNLFNFPRVLNWYFLVPAVLAYLFDLTENFLYLSQTLRNSSFLLNNIGLIVGAKIGLYAVTFLVFLYYFFFDWYNGKDAKHIAFKAALKSVIKSSWVSLIVIILIVVLISFTAQGGTLIVALCSEPFNIIVFLLLYNFLALIVSHYPIYIRNLKEENTGRWFLSKALSLFGIGIIYYLPEGKYPNADGVDLCYGKQCATNPEIQSVSDDLNQKELDLIKEKKERFENIFRRYLGIIIYLALLFGLFTIANHYFSIQFPASSATFLIFIFISILFYKIDRDKSNFKKLVISPLKKNLYEKENEVFIRKINWRINTYIFLILTSIFLNIFLIVVTANVGWSKLTFILLCMSTTLSMVIFLHFRILRSVFYRFYDLSPKYDFKSTKDIAITKFLSEYALIKRLPIKWFTNISSNIYYAETIRLFWFLNSCFVLYMFLNIYYNETSSLSHLNPLVVFLSWFILYYSLLIIFIKHMLFYNQKADCVLKRWKEKINGEWIYNTALVNKNVILFFKRIVPKLSFILIIMIGYGYFKGNDLHNIFSEKQDESQLNDFTSYRETWRTRTNRINTDSLPLSMISSYGGGLKSNIWTLLVMNELLPDKLTENSFGNIVSMSGVSGGSIGLSNFAAIVSSSESKAERHKRIEAIGLSNTLSHEINHFLGRDLLREFIPIKWFKGKDRSYFSMRANAQLAFGKQYNNKVEKSYTELWKELNQKYNFPALFSNSKSTSYHYGYTSPFKNLPPLPGGIDIAHNYHASHLYHAKVPAFYDAISATNRFPLISPAAKFEGKGHFVDGGYFENSGQLTNLSFIEEMNLDKDSIYSVIISNGKGDYLRHFLDEFYKGDNTRTEETKSNTEFSSILGALINLDGLPTYFEMKKHEKQHKIFIHLPHMLYYKDVVDFLKGRPDKKESLRHKLKENNDAVIKALEKASDAKNPNYDIKNWGVVEPPLSRLLSRPGFEYQRAMIKYHPQIVKEIKEASKFTQR